MRANYFHKLRTTLFWSLSNRIREAADASSFTYPDSTVLGNRALCVDMDIAVLHALADRFRVNDQFDVMDTWRIEEFSARFLKPQCRLLSLAFLRL